MVHFIVFYTYPYYSASAVSASFVSSDAASVSAVSASFVSSDAVSVVSASSASSAAESSLSTTPPSTTRSSGLMLSPYTGFRVSSKSLWKNCSSARALISSLIAFRRSVFPFCTAGAIVSISPRDSIPTENPLFCCAHASTYVLSVEKASPLPSRSAS